MPHRGLLTEHGSRREPEVDAHVDRQPRNKVELHAMDGVLVFRIDGPAITNEAVLAIDVHLDPIGVLAGALALVVVLRQVFPVLGIGRQATRLTVELPAGRLDLLGQFVPPMVVIRRVGRHDDSRPVRAAHCGRRVATHTAGQAIDHSLRHFAGFVHPGAGQFHTEQLGNVVRAIKRHEDDLQVDLGVLDVVHRRARVHPAPQRRRYPLVPGLDGRRLEFRVGVTHHSPARATLAISADDLLLGATDDLHDADGRLAGAERPHDALHEGVRLQERPRNRARRLVDDAGRLLCHQTLIVMLSAWTLAFSDCLSTSRQPARAFIQKMAAPRSRSFVAFSYSVLAT